MQGLRWPEWPCRFGGSMLVATAVLAGCAGPSGQATVEDRGTAVTSQSAAVPASAGSASAVSSAYNRAGYYTVQPGDTLIRISLDSGQNWRDIVRWNDIQNPDLIEVGQVLRTSTNVPIPVQPAGLQLPGMPVQEAGGVVSLPVTSSTLAATAVPDAVAPTPAAVSPKATAATGKDDDLTFAWPVNGALLSGFDNNKNKGLDLGGKVGDPVLAAADGKVVYAGAGLRGYGNLLILKHNNTYLTAYAHNHSLMVKEDQSVRKGQKIAEMGRSDADRVKLHFEVRRQGTPVDPAKYLPAR